jgi:hypothetical protein
MGKPENTPSRCRTCSHLAQKIGSPNARTGRNALVLNVLGQLLQSEHSLFFRIRLTDGVPAGWWLPGRLEVFILIFAYLATMRNLMLIGSKTRCMPRCSK